MSTTGAASSRGPRQNTNTNTNRSYKARLTNCPGAQTNVKTRDGIDEFLKDFLSASLYFSKRGAY